MKKLLSVSILLMAALLLFVGCPKEADPNALPGAWPTTVQLRSSTGYAFTDASDNDIGSLTPRANKTFEYVLDDPYEVSPKPSAGSYTATTFTVANDTDLTGFEVEVTSTAEYCGLAFNITTGSSWSYYMLDLSPNSFMIRSKNGSTTDTEIGWTRSAAIKTTGQTNKILVYKDTDGHILVKINDVLVHTIENPLFTSGKVGVECCATGEECAAHDAIGTTFKFLRFQK